MKQKYILGISCFYHDSSATLIKDGHILSAVQEERFTRIKFDPNFPINSINYCLENAKIDIESVEYISFYENPNLKFQRIIHNYAENFPSKIIDNYKKINKWLKNKYLISQYIKFFLPKFMGKIIFAQHHLSHAASAFFPSPYSESAILTIDGVGEFSSSTICFGKENKISLIKQQNYPNSLGLLYSAFTSFLGFKVLSGEYKMMGLAPYGEPKYYQLIRDKICEIKENGSIDINQEYFNFNSDKKIYNDNLEKIFVLKNRNEDDIITIEHMNIASSIQKIVEESIVKMSDYALNITKSKNLCLAGGVALNCVANGKLLKLIDKLENIWIQPAAGDAGASLGSALYTFYDVLNNHRLSDNVNDKQKNSLLGKEYNDKDILEIFKSYNIKFTTLTNGTRAKKIANFISEEKIVAHFNGKMEFGPRALGNRSILGDARSPNMQKKMNLKIKFRESFRPFAPIVLEKEAKNWFELDQKSPYMLLTTKVKDDKLIQSKNEEPLLGFKKLDILRSVIPAVTHVDNSARVQTVNSESNPDIYDILEEFFKITKCPIMINTSFNVRGEPIVLSPLDALICFFSTNIDYLVINSFIISRENQDTSIISKQFKLFKPD